MNELFLIAITLLTTRIHGSDRAPALTYCLIAHAFYQLCMVTNSDALAFMMGGVIDAVFIGILMCFNGCLRSRITYFLIPLSFLSIVIHFTGWVMDLKAIESDAFNSIVAFYMCVIIALFFSRAIRYGDSNRDSRFLRRDNVRDKNMGAISK